jgi:hypothetical protein
MFHQETSLPRDSYTSVPPNAILSIRRSRVRKNLGVSHYVQLRNVVLFLQRSFRFYNPHLQIIEGKHFTRRIKKAHRKNATLIKEQITTFERNFPSNVALKCSEATSVHHQRIEF